MRLIVPDLFDPPWAEKLQIAIPSKAEGSQSGLKTNVFVFNGQSPLQIKILSSAVAQR